MIPAGSDSQENIDQAFLNQSISADPEEPFEDVIPMPSFLRDRLKQRDAPISVAVAETGQEFLQRHLTNLGSSLSGSSVPATITAAELAKHPESATSHPTIASHVAPTVTPNSSSLPASTPELSEYFDFFNSFLSDGVKTD